MTRQEKIKAITDLIMSKDYGDVITHAEIIILTKERGKTQTYWDAVSAAGKRCINGGKMIESVHGVGYKVVEPDNYTDQSIKYIASGARRINHGAKILDHAPVQDMSQDGLERYNRVTDKMRVLNAALAGAKVEIFRLNTGRSHPLAIQSRG